jgi:hypothetical protein
MQRNATLQATLHETQMQRRCNANHSGRGNGKKSHATKTQTPRIFLSGAGASDCVSRVLGGEAHNKKLAISNEMR